MPSLEELYDGEHLRSLHEGLEACAAAKLRFEEARSDGERGGLASAYLTSLARLVQVTAGPEIMRAAYGEDLPADASRADHLLQLARRTRLAARLFSNVSKSTDSASLDALAHELREIGNGAEPHLVAKVPARRGSKREAYRKAELKLSALAWEQVLLRLGDSEKSARETVQDLFGVAKLSDWRQQLADMVGSNLLEQILRFAKEGALLEFADVPNREIALARMRADKSAIDVKLRSRT